MLYSSRYLAKTSQQGFTLIELVMTIVIIGILGVGISNFVGRTTQGMIDTADRQQIATIGWIISEKTSRDLRRALPNSVRMNGSNTCVEFIPVIAGTDYLTVPIITTANNFEVVPFSNYENADVNTTTDRVAVYPNTLIDLYNSTLPNPGVISSLMTSMVAGATANAIQINLAANHQFLSDSLTKRLFIIQEPIAYCFSGEYLYKYTNYGFATNMPTFPTGASGEVQTVMGSRLSSGTFTYTAGVLTRSAVITMQFDVTGSNGDQQSINQEVQIRNVP